MRDYGLEISHSSERFNGSIARAATVMIVDDPPEVGGVFGDFVDLFVEGGDGAGVADFGVAELLFEFGAQAAHLVFEELVLVFEVLTRGEFGFERGSAAEDFFGFIDDTQEEAGHAEQAEEAAGDVAELLPGDCVRGHFGGQWWLGE